MRKFITSRPLFALSLVSFVFSLSLITVVVSCRKIETQSEEIKVDQLATKFFTTHQSSDPVILAAENFVKKQNEKYKFLSSLTKRIGFPYWDKSMVFAKSYSARGSSADSENIVYIPFARDTQNSVNAALIIKMKPTDTSFRFLYDWQYASYGFDTSANGEKWNARDIFHIFTVFDKSVFGVSKFRITNKNLLSASEKESIKNLGLNLDSAEMISTLKENESITQTIITIESCETYSVCLTQCRGFRGTGLNVQQPPQEGECCKESTWQICTFYSYIDNDDDIGGGSGGGGAGGTGNGGGWTDPCAPDGQPATQICGDPGWQPIPPDHNNSYNPYDADNVTLDTSLTNNFPCVKKIIDSLTGYLNVNALAQVALNTVFGINEKMHFTIKVEPSWGQANDDADTRPDSSYVIGEDFFATMRLNPWVLTHSTQEYTAATIIHEAIHAYIDFKYYQYLTGIIDSTTFKTLFPLYWPPRFSNGYYLPLGNNSQHNVMASNLVTIMTEPLKSLYPNSNISTTLRDSIYNGISWGGLQDCQVFSTRSDSLSIFAINLMSRDTSIHAPFYLRNDPGTLYTFDSHNLNMKTGCH